MLPCKLPPSCSTRMEEAHVDQIPEYPPARAFETHLHRLHQEQSESKRSLGATNDETVGWACGLGCVEVHAH